MLTTILSFTLGAGIIFFLLVISERLIRKNAVLEKEAKNLQELIADISPEQEDNKSMSDTPEKPVTVESVMEALRFNGFSLEKSDSDNQDIIYFWKDELHYRVVAEHLPFLSFELGMRLDEKEDIQLLQQAAAEVTWRMFIAKLYLTADNKAIIFSSELLCDTYTHLKTNLTHYLDVLSDARRRLRETCDELRERQSKEREAAFSGKCFVKDSPSGNKIQS